MLNHNLPMWARYPVGLVTVFVVALLAFRFVPLLGFSRGIIFAALIGAIAIFAYILVFYPSLLGWRKKDA